MWSLAARSPPPSFCVLSPPPPLSQWQRRTTTTTDKGDDDDDGQRRRPPSFSVSLLSSVSLSPSPLLEPLWSEEPAQAHLPTSSTLLFYRVDEVGWACGTDRQKASLSLSLSLDLFLSSLDPRQKAVYAQRVLNPRQEALKQQYTHGGCCWSCTEVWKVEVRRVLDPRQKAGCFILAKKQGVGSSPKSRDRDSLRMTGCSILSKKQRSWFSTHGGGSLLAKNQRSWSAGALSSPKWRAGDILRTAGAKKTVLFILSKQAKKNFFLAWSHFDRNTL